MGASVPKQFMKIGGRTIIEWTIQALARHDEIAGIYVGLADTKEHGNWIDTLPKVWDVFAGGSTRSETVLNGIEHILKYDYPKEDWLVIHDANRPFITQDEITRLIECVGDDDNGGILSLPVVDTLKSGEADRISTTMSRENCYRALTPQMFKIGLLREALIHCAKNNIDATDESQAMEVLGYHPHLVPGNALNIKITTPTDLKFAEAILESEALPEIDSVQKVFVFTDHEF